VAAVVAAVPTTTFRSDRSGWRGLLVRRGSRGAARLARLGQLGWRGSLGWRVVIRPGWFDARRVPAGECRLTVVGPPQPQQMASLTSMVLS
jgi:hypothetical protein